MFVRKKPEKDGGVSSAEAEQIITKAMGVRVPPKRVQREEYEVQRVERVPPLFAHLCQLIPRIARSDHRTCRV